MSPRSGPPSPIPWPVGRADVLYEQFKKCVLDQHWSAGQALNISGLARQYAVSITPVREALARLSADRLVVAMPNRGYAVAPLPTVAYLAGLCDVRLLLEPAAARGAAHRVSPEQLAELQAIHREIAGLPGGAAYDDMQAFAGLNRAFHRLIFQANGNEALSEVYDGLGYHVLVGHVYRDRHIDELPQVVGEHQALLAALAAGDGAGAERAMRDHIVSGSQRLLQWYRVPPRR